MKQIKFWLMAILAIVAVGSLTSCSDDKDEENVINSPIVGSWSHQIAYNTSDGVVDNLYIVKFNANGTYEWTYREYYYDDGETYTEGESGNYIVKNNTIMLECVKLSAGGSGGPVSYFVGQESKLDYELSGKTLRIDQEDSGYFVEYTKMN